MKELSVRYGGSLDLPVLSDDASAVSASIYVGLPGQLPVISKTASFAAGEANLSLGPTNTAVPLKTYKYQINVTYAGGVVKKFPDPSTCGGELPDFIVAEALDATEVV